MKFKKELIDAARVMYFKVYVDRVTHDGYYGSEKAYTGDRVRIYPTGWEYEECDVMYTDDELETYLMSDIAED